MPETLTTDDLLQLVPAGTAVRVSATPPAADCTLPAGEDAATRTMRPARRRDFAHGRECARAALAELGRPVPAIPLGAHREPDWPPGIVGSISHCGTLAAAAVARHERVRGLGIDIEVARPLDAATRALILTAAESARLADAPDPPSRALLIFSAKESIYKCIWPSVRRFVDFREIAIRIDEKAGTFRAEAWSDDLPDALIGALDGRFSAGDGWLVTVASLAGPGR